MPTGIGIIDTMMDLPFDDVRSIYEFLTPNLKDAASKEEFEFPAQYMFKKVPAAAEAGVSVVVLEHPFLIVKRDFAFTKTRYRGIAKNLNHLNMLLASANWLMRTRAVALMV